MRLVVIDESGSERALPIEADRVTVGRARDNVVRLPDRFVSRHHAELRRTGDGWVIRDLGSRSGTIVNRARLEGPAPLLPGDSVQLGATTLRIDDTTDEQVSISVSDGATRDGVSHEVRARRAVGSHLVRAVSGAVRAMISGRSTARTLREVLGIALDVTDADRGVIALVRPDGSIEEKASVLRRGQGEIEMSRACVVRALEGREALVLREVDAGAGRDTLRRQDVRSVLCTPLVTDRAIRGLLYIDSVGRRADFDDSHLELVSTLSALCGIALQQEDARRTAAATRQLEIQLDAAAEIQRKLLPPRDPVPPPGFSAAAWHSMCHAVGGDLYDFFLSSHGYGALLADVSGKRLDGALIMANLHAEWHAVSASGRTPGEWLEQLNRRMHACLPENRFVTLAFALADPDEDRLLFASAGHNPCFLLNGGDIKRLTSTGLALGIVPSLDVAQKELAFEPGDRLVLYTDGLLDQLDPDGEPFGEQRVTDVLESAVGESPREIRRRLLEALERHSGDAAQDDDITIAILGREPGRD